METLKRGLIYPDESFRIQGAIFEVYKYLGPGFSEKVYQECLLREFELCNLPFRSQPEVSIEYKGALLTASLRPDFICFERILLEIKAQKALDDMHRSQILHYLKATRLKLGLLINFCGYPKVEIERFVNKDVK